MSANAESMEGSTEWLALRATRERGVGEELTIIAEGAADGSDRLSCSAKRCAAMPSLRRPYRGDWATITEEA